MTKDNRAVIVENIVKITQDQTEIVRDYVIEEMPLTVFLNGQELVTMLCSPGDEYYLVLGFLSLE